MRACRGWDVGVILPRTSRGHPARAQISFYFLLPNSAHHLKEPREKLGPEGEASPLPHTVGPEGEGSPPSFPAPVFEVPLQLPALS